MLDAARRNRCPLSRLQAVNLLKDVLTADFNAGVTCDYTVLRETSGAQKFERRFGVHRIMIENPGGGGELGEKTGNLWSNIDYLHALDEVKFPVMGSREDYEWSRD